MRSLAHIAFGFAALIIAAAAWPALFGLVRIAPVLVAITALYLGLTSRGRLAAPVASSLAVGYLADVLSGTPSGLLALSCALVCIAGHVAQGRFVIRGLVASVVASFSAATLFAVLVVGLGRAVGVAGASALHVSLPILVGNGAVTGLLGPLLLSGHRRIDARLARTQRDRDAALEGVSGS